MTVAIFPPNDETQTPVYCMLRIECFPHQHCQEHMSVFVTSPCSSSAMNKANVQASIQMFPLLILQLTLTLQSYWETDEASNIGGQMHS